MEILRERLTYRTPIGLEVAAMTKPTIATDLEAVMCQVRSLNLPDNQDTRIVLAPAMRYGGQVRTRVIVRPKSRVSTTVGNCGDRS